MKKIIYIASAALLMSCGVKNQVNVDEPKSNQGFNNYNVTIVPIEKEKPAFVVGHFTSPYNTDTLVFREYSNKSKRYVDSTAEFDDIGWYRDNGIEYRVLLADSTIIHSERFAAGVARAKPLPGLLPDVDAIAIVWHWPQQSSIVPCRIVTIEDGCWQKLGEFTVNTNCFTDTDEDSMIEGVLEKRNGRWMYRDYDEQMRWWEDHHEGQCPMKPLSDILNDTFSLYRYFNPLLTCQVDIDHDNYKTEINFLEEYIKVHQLPKRTIHWPIDEYCNGPHHFGIKLGMPKNYTNDVSGYKDLINAYIQCGLAYMEIGNDERFIEYMTLASDRWPNVATLDYLWQHYFYNHNYAKAQSFAQRMIKIEPQCHLGHLRSAQTYNRQKKYAKALAPAIKAIECEDRNSYPNWHNPYYVRAETYIGLGMNDKAFDDCMIYLQNGRQCSCGDDIFNMLITNASSLDKRKMLKEMNVDEKEILETYNEWRKDYPNTQMFTVINHLLSKHFDMVDFADVMSDND